ncbi:RHS repeat-associated core domain-containing protein [Lentisphaerota bacterium WC36G]|nr:RHS repeat-associated core domain-containing protein [Lentisphaerae bacterium WC36]
MNNGSISDRFVWLGDNLLALEKDGVVFNYIADGNKNITQLIDMSSGSIANRYDYSPFGQLSLDNETVANPFKFSSEYAEKETGLIYYNYRYYNPTTGKWLSRDPIQEKGGENIYGFVNNQPISNTDNLGQAFVAMPLLGMLATLASEAMFLAIGISAGGLADGCTDCKKSKCQQCCSDGAAILTASAGVAYALGIGGCFAGGIKTLWKVWGCVASVDLGLGGALYSIAKGLTACNMKCAKLKD